MTKQYETLFRNSISSRFEKGTVFYFLGLFSKYGRNLFCGNGLTVAQKSLANHVHLKKTSPYTYKCPSSVEKNDTNKSIIKYAFLY